MTRIFSRGGLAVSLSVLAAPAAWSMTAEEAWEAWVEVGSRYGQEISAQSTEKVGDTMTVSGITAKIEAEEMTVSSQIGEARLIENPDGTVSIVTPEALTVDLVSDPEYGEKVEAKLGLEVSGLQTVASDAGGATTFTYSAARITATLEELKADGVAVPFNLMAVLGGLNGNYAIGSGTPATLTSMLSAQSTEISFDGRDPEGEGDVEGKISVAGLTTSSTGTGDITFMSMEDLPALLRAGAEISGNTVIGATSFELQGRDAGESFAISGSMDGGTGASQLSGEEVTYSTNYQNLQMRLSGSEIPLPEVALGMRETNLNLVFPLGQSDSPKPFLLSVGLHDLTLADGVWNLFDPGTVLPRDPATLTFNIAGQGNWLIDIMDPEVMAQGPQGVPGELHALTLSDVRLSLAGAEFTADGNFTFDNSDLTTFNGFPAPDGILNAKLVGGNALLDNLVAMRLLPAEQANAIKLGAGAFARPGGEDTLTTQITVSPDGTVAANGIPIPF